MRRMSRPLPEYVTMATIQIAANISAEAFARVQALAAETEKTNPNWNGADIRVERGDFTCVEDADELAGSALLHAVHRAIDGE